jgi:uncharacterized protein DUF1326
MKRAFLAALLATITIVAVAAADDAAKQPAWSMNASVIEACSCPMFCQCYFSTQPAGHTASMEGHEGHDMSSMGQEHYCRFNNAYKVNKGTYGSVKLDGAKFWIAGDLGGDFSKGQMDWAVVTFDKATTKEQREAIGAIASRLFPVKWNSLTTAEGEIQWVAGKQESYALLDGGKSGEVRLKATDFNKDSKAEPTIIKNLKYWGASKNDGFILMPNTVEAYRVGDKTYEFKGTNGFMITFDVDSKTAPPAATGM